LDGDPDDALDHPGRHIGSSLVVFNTPLLFGSVNYTQIVGSCTGRKGSRPGSVWRLRSDCDQTEEGDQTSQNKNLTKADWSNGFSAFLSHLKVNTATGNQVAAYLLRPPGAKW
jgi:hypothetical protein